MDKSATDEITSDNDFIHSHLSFEQAMAGLCVTDSLLNRDQRDALDRDGYLILPNIIGPEWIERLRARVDEQSAKEGSSGNHEAHDPEAGTRRVADLVNKGEVFDRVWSHPKILAAIRHVIARPFKLSSLNYREAMQGGGQQDLHADWTARKPDEPFHVCNSIWLLDDFTADNGSTRLVPGSQLIAGAVADHVADPAAPHPKQIQLIAPAGTVAVFNSHIWHGGTLNKNGARRRACHAYYCGRDARQQTPQAEHIRVKTWRRLSQAQRWLLDV